MQKILFFLFQPLIFAIFSPICPLGEVSCIINHQKLFFFLFTIFSVNNEQNDMWMRNKMQKIRFFIYLPTPPPHPRPDPVWPLSEVPCFINYQK